MPLLHSLKAGYAKCLAKELHILWMTAGRASSDYLRSVIGMVSRIYELSRFEMNFLLTFWWFYLIYSY